MNSPFFTLESGVERHRLAPDSFEIPHRWRRERLRVGDWAKLLFEIPREGEAEVERMWVQVTRVLPEYYLGSLDNDSTRCDALRRGHPVEFHADHVINILLPRIYLEDAYTPKRPENA